MGPEGEAKRAPGKGAVDPDQGQMQQYCQARQEDDMESLRGAPLIVSCGQENTGDGKRSGGTFTSRGNPYQLEILQWLLDKRMQRQEYGRKIL